MNSCVCRKTYPNCSTANPKLHTIRPSYHSLPTKINQIRLRPLAGGLAVLVLALAVVLAPHRVLAHLLGVVPQLVLLHLPRRSLGQRAEDDALRGLVVLHD